MYILVQNSHRRHLYILNINSTYYYLELFCASRPYGVVSRPGRAYFSPGRPFYPITSHLVIFLVHLVVYLGLGSPLVLCTRNFIATPNLKKRSNDTLSLTRLSACLHLTWSSTEPGIFGAVGFCDSKLCPCAKQNALYCEATILAPKIDRVAPAAMCTCACGHV